MTLLTVWDETEPTTPVVQTRDFDEIVNVLTPLGVRFSRWDLKPLSADPSQEEVLEAYREEIDAVIAEHGYGLVDALKILPDHTPDYAKTAADSRVRFLNEHQHDDDEDRFFARGTGVFYLHVGAKVHAVFCEAGDVISVPANTTHWFDMGTHPEYISVRFFHDEDGWVGNFTGSGISERFATYDELALIPA